ncbi:hypothetical protein BG418_16320 [Streptomyces sp. CBMA152]|nr:hypothetical protein [Streptomyces sp. CBMA152]MBD0743139.1 hypothetical protein [Streptomyces sp. CBMA152]
MKVKALGLRPQGCTASTATLAAYLGMSKASVERGLTQLRGPAPDGVVELPQNARRSLPGGTGTTARRQVRAMTSSERFVWLPVAACEALTPRQLRAYAVLVFTQVQRIPLTLGELAGFLRHHSGTRAGQPVTAAAAASVVGQLEAAGWVSVGRRAGTRGRHQYVAHEIPPAAVRSTRIGVVAVARCAHSAEEALPGRAATAVVGEGSGASVGEGSLANEESPRTDRPDDERGGFPPAVGALPVGGGPGVVLDRPEAASAAEVPRNRAPRARETTRAASSTPTTKGRGSGARSPRSPYAEARLAMSPQVHAALEPVHWLLKRVESDVVLRKIAQEAGRQLRDGTAVDRLRHRLTVRFAGTSPSLIRDPGRWLLGVALPRWGCGHFDCEAGVLWSTGALCALCEEVVADRRAARRRERALRPDDGAARPGSGMCDSGPAMADPDAATASARAPQWPPRGECADCGCRILLVKGALTDGLCGPCREGAARSSAPTGQPEPVRCSHTEGVPCGRPALPTRGVCVRHRAHELVGAVSN